MVDAKNSGHRNSLLLSFDQNATTSKGAFGSADRATEFMQPFGEFAKNFSRRFDGFKLTSESRPVRAGGGFQNLQTPSDSDGCEPSFLNFSLRLCELTAELTGTDRVGGWAKNRRQQQSPDDRQRPQIETTTNEPCLKPSSMRVCVAF